MLTQYKASDSRYRTPGMDGSSFIEAKGADKGAQSRSSHHAFPAHSCIPRQ